MIIITIIYKKTTSSQMLTVFRVILLADTAVYKLVLGYGF